MCPTSNLILNLRRLAESTHTYTSESKQTIKQPDTIVLSTQLDYKLGLACNFGRCAICTIILYT